MSLKHSCKMLNTAEKIVQHACDELKLIEDMLEDEDEKDDAITEMEEVVLATIKKLQTWYYRRNDQRILLRNC